jgi:methyl-accepting chemotaxis protein
MPWLNHLKIRSKLMVMMGATLALTVTVGAFALWQMASINAQSTVLANRWLPSIEYAGQIDATSRQLQSMQFQHVALSNAADMADMEKRIDATLEELKQAKAIYTRDYLSTPAEQAIFEQLTAAWDRFYAAWPVARELSRNGKTEEAAAALVAVTKDFREMDAEINKLIAVSKAGAEEARQHGDALYSRAKLLVLAALAFACVLGVAMALVVSGRIATTVAILSERTDSLRRVCIAGTREALSAMALGDMSVSVTPKTQPINNTDRDELGDISRGIDGIIGDVTATIAAFTRTQTAIRTVISETQTLVDAARRGDLAQRADALQHQGAFRELVDGLNGTLSAVEAPIGEAKSVLAQLANRDLTGRMTGTYQGDYAEMQRSINQAIENLEGTLTQVAMASDQVSSAGTQITAGGQSLASGSSQQAASLEEVSASVQEFSMMARQSAANAQEAQRMATEARGDATEGAARMERLTTAVNEIKQASAETAKIMKSIEEIAFQTNLLALNAAVEAARAGDAGRGFAVVADEVRALAIRSADASKSTAELIERGLASAERGVALNAEVSQSFGRINDQVSRVTDVMADIASAAEQQASGVSQINAALEQLNAVTQQVAANAEESASAAEELESQARSLNDTVGSFTLSTSGGGRKGGGAPARKAASTRSHVRGGQRTPHAPARPLAGVAAGGHDDDEVFLGF